MYSFDTFSRVRYGETDQMGYVYYGNYALFYEMGRVELMRSLGLSYKSLEEGGILMPVYDMQVRFLKPARYDNLLRIRTTVPELPAARMKFTYEIFNEAEELVNTGSTTLLFLKADNYRPCRAPEALLNALEVFFG